MRTPAMNAMASTDERGTRFRATRRQSWWPGTAPSRENANSIREADVNEAVTQKNCATTQMKSRNSAQRTPIDSVQIHGTIGTRLFTCTSASWVVPGIANVTATSRMNPKTTETKTEVHIPVAAIRDAWFVSSAVCAEASNPVIVYCDNRSPSPNTNQNAG